ncbi:MAG TPA: glutathione S-transferase family protein [Candidatus Binatia bacterium]|nr:glutathione S-transferase family protein [Candidatus Binatia bacterium]
MKLHCHPLSTTSRCVMFFVEDAGIKVELVTVDLFTGEHTKEPFANMNPSKMVPVLDDDGFILTESSAILKYIAEKAGSPAYPAGDIRARARINESMDWINVNFYRDFGYGLIYPQIFPNHKRPTDESQKVTLDWGKERSQGWLGILDAKILGKRKFLASDTLSIADYFGLGILTSGELVGCEFKAFPNVMRWLDAMKQRPGYAKVFGPFNQFTASLKDKQFAHV